MLQYWDSHCSTFSKVPALAVLAPGSCPKGLAPALFVELLSRLTDLQQWQIWALWDTLDSNSCGFVSTGPALYMLLPCCCWADCQPDRAAVSFLHAQPQDKKQDLQQNSHQHHRHVMLE